MFEGIYVHVPFCGRKCPYCDFFSVVSSPLGAGEYLGLLVRELRLYADRYRFKPKTVYFGGGTPSLLKPEFYEKLLSEFAKLVDLSRVEEITIEVNPESYSLKDFKKLREVGFNRLSIGVQSFSDRNLRLLGRTHSAERAKRAVLEAAEAGFENLSVDLIWGLPDQGPDDLERELEVLDRLPVVHASAYLLTVYEETPLFRLREEGKFRPPDQEEVEKLYFTLLRGLRELGFERYEVSNFAKEKRYRSLHNLLYWRSRPWLGLGASAWSFDGRRRWANPRDLRLYAERLRRNEPPAAQVFDLSEEELFKEKLLMALRTTEGVPRSWIEGRLPPEVVKEFFVPAKGGKNLAFNDRGFLVSNYLLSELI
ncbi:MAG: radical SAM family heme chaperone HemW [Aquificae bacterium]|nr:radical SAM family heme chaperone HemW [Aquificota bacterium]